MLLYCAHNGSTVPLRVKVTALCYLHTVEAWAFALSSFSNADRLTAGMVNNRQFPRVEACARREGARRTTIWLRRWVDA